MRCLGWLVVRLQVECGYDLILGLCAKTSDKIEIIIILKLRLNVFLAPVLHTPGW